MAYAKIRPKRGTRTQWSQANTILAEGELGIEVPDAGIGKGQVKVKQGDGSTPWNSLPYAIDLTDFVEHLEDTENPHETTWEQVGAAPGGFGLGGRAPLIDDCNDAVKNGWYTVSGGTNCPAGYSYGWMAVSVGVSGYVRQDFYTSTVTPDHFERYCIDGVWSAWDNISKYAFAPAGYGLGLAKLLTSADDVNTIKANGWYHWHSHSKPKNIPTLSSTDYMNSMRVWTNDGGVCCQEIMDMSDSSNRGLKIQRTIYGSKVYDWEWVNPPMVLGYEYRTTERWDGRPVFTQIINCGQAADKKTVSYLNPEQIHHIIRFAGKVGGISVPSFNANDFSNAYSAQIMVGTVSATIRCGTSLVGAQTYLQIWYVKGAEYV